jgi:hypothetical protein
MNPPLEHQTNMTASKRKPFPDGKQAEILLSGVTTMTTLRPCHLDGFVEPNQSLASTPSRRSRSTCSATSCGRSPGS